jgi:syntaxin 7
MSFAKFKKQDDNNLSLDLESGTQNGLTATLKHISNCLAQLTSRISHITRAQNQLGTSRDTPKSREMTSMLILECQETYDILMKDFDYLDSFILDNENIKDINNNIDKEIMTVKFSKDLLRTQVQNVYNNYQILVRSYNDKINSATVKEQFDKNQTEKKQIAQQQQQQQQNSATDKTPLLLSLSPSNQTQTQQTQVQLQLQQQQQQQKISDAALQYHSDLIQQRDQAITSISQGVQDINKIFKDLDEIVNQQGEQIDSIENNMINYATNNQLASHELVKANNYQKKKGKWTCIILVVLVIILLIFLALIS